MTFYILSKYRIEALDFDLGEFIGDDLIQIIKSSSTNIVTKYEEYIKIKDNYKHCYKLKIEKETTLERFFDETGS